MDARAAAAASRTSELNNQLRNLKGDLSGRIDTLATAFAAYVELDGIREQLAAYPNHNQARRLAGADLKQLLAGEPAEQRADVPSYWLVPAVNALRPDGSVDADLLATALRRDEVSTRRFMLSARAAMGLGPQLVDELVALMAPHDEAGVPTWDAVQVIWWASVLRGAFGSDALAALRPVAEPALATLTGGDWLDWANRTQSEGQVRSFGNRTRSDTENLRWLGDQLSAATEPVDQASDDQSWRMSWQAPPTSADAEAQAPTSQDDPEAANRSTMEMLAGLAAHLIARGSTEEVQLLARATELRSELADPGHRGRAASEPIASGLPAQPTAVSDEVRATAVDPNASLADRRELWRWLAPNLRTWLTEVAEQPAPLPAVLPARSNSSLLVDANGVVSKADLDRAQLELARNNAPGGLARYGRPILIGGAAVAVLGVLLATLGGQGAGWIVLVVGAVLGIFGWSQFSQALASQTNIDAGQAQLTARINEVQANAKRTDAANLARHQEQLEVTRRALNMLPE